jgi:hypothetical protein
MDASERRRLHIVTIAAWVGLMIGIAWIFAIGAVCEEGCL